MTSRIHISYITDNENPRRRMCVVRRWISDNKMEYAYSMNNPVDQFEKKKARMIATGRLETRPSVVTVEDGTHPMDAISRDILKRIELSNHVHRVVETNYEYHKARSDFARRIEESNFINPLRQPMRAG